MSEGSEPPAGPAASDAEERQAPPDAAPRVERRRDWAARLDGALALVEPAFVFLVLVSVVGGGVFTQLFGQDRGLAPWIKLLHENWKGAAIILLALFFRTARTFLEEVQEAFGMKRSRPVPPEETVITPGRVS